MILKRISILNYKNLEQAELEFSPKMNCFIGQNGMGKTNLLDAVYYLSFCKSATNPIDSQNIRHEGEFFVIQGFYETDQGEPEEVYCGLKRRQKKQFKRNKKEYNRLSDHIGFIPLVMVSPADAELIAGGSDGRRRFMDVVISQYDKEYLDALIRYNKALTQRNALLKSEQEFDEELDARDRERQTLLQQLQSETAIQQGVQTQEEVTSGEVSEHTPESDPGQEMIHKVYLTFDDGPSIYTDEILDILDRYHVKATFFVVGKDGSEAEAALQRIVEDGHTLGMHSYSHKYKELYESLDSFTEDFARIRDDIYQATGVESVYYRFPGGSSNTVSNIDMHEFIDYLDSQGVEYFDWNVSSGDGGSRNLPIDTLLENCTEDIDTRETSIILLHDSAEKPTTVEALPDIIENILARPDTVILPITENTRPVHHVE
jgi:DNA replication and repair protein RecF